MNFQEALEVLKRGGRVNLNGRIYQIGRGIEDVTDGGVKRVRLDEAALHAENWALIIDAEPPVEAVAPEAVDAVLTESPPA